MIMELPLRKWQMCELTEKSGMNAMRWKSSGKWFLVSSIAERNINKILYMFGDDF